MRPSSARTIFAGTLVGILGALSLLASTALASGERPSVGTIGAGLVVAAVGVALAVVLAFATLRTRRTQTLALFGVVFAPALWFCIDVFVFKRLGRELPVHVMTMAAIPFGACFGLIAPLRGPWRSVPSDDAHTT